MTRIGVDFETTRVNYNLPTKLVNRVKEYAKENGVPITYAVVLLLQKGLDNDEIIKQLPKITKIYDELKENRLSDTNINVSETTFSDTL